MMQDIPSLDVGWLTQLLCRSISMINEQLADHDIFLEGYLPSRQRHSYYPCLMSILGVSKRQT